jgi:hypothetical protein
VDERPELHRFCLDALCCGVRVAAGMDEARRSDPRPRLGVSREDIGDGAQRRRPDPVQEGHRSSTPEILKAPRGELGVPHDGLNAAMAEIGLQRARVGAFVRQRKASAVPQHVRMDLERQLGLYVCAFDEFGNSVSGLCPSRAAMDLADAF